MNNIYLPSSASLVLELKASTTTLSSLEDFKNSNYPNLLCLLRGWSHSQEDSASGTLPLYLWEWKKSSQLRTRCFILRTVMDFKTPSVTLTNMCLFHMLGNWVFDYPTSFSLLRWVAILMIRNWPAFMTVRPLLCSGLWDHSVQSANGCLSLHS